MKAIHSLGLYLLLFCSASAQDMRTLQHQGVSRSYLVHNVAAAKSEPKPTIIALHGFRSPGEPITAEGQLDRIAWSKLDEVALREGFVTVYPGAIDGKWNYMPGLAEPVRAGTEIADDVGFISRVIDALISDRIADSRRIYITGFSRGALMTFEMLCRAPSYFAAAVPVAGSMTESQRESCKNERAAPIAVIAGTNDLDLFYDGWIFSHGRLMSVPETLDFWRRQHDCTGQEGKLLPQRTSSGTRIRVVTWTGCRVPDSVKLYRVEPGGHQAPSFEPSPQRWIEKYGRRNLDMETAEELWRFMRNFMK